MSVVIRNSCSRIGSAPPTRVAVKIPLPTASALCSPIIPQSLAVGKNQLIGPIKPNVSDNSQMATPTPMPANQFAATSHLQGERDCCESANQTGYEKRRVNWTKQNA